MRYIFCYKIIIIFFSMNVVFGNLDYLKIKNPDSLRLKTIRAVRCFEAPKIDGKRDDIAWESTDAVDDFFQIDPKELAPPSEYTSSRIMYDNNAIYVFLEAVDSEPGLIKKSLVRRDSWMEGFSNKSDWMGITIDSRNDDYNGYFFAVNASGAKMDVILSGDDEYDPTWDPVWEAEISFNDKGWSAEFLLPLAIFQFDNTPNMEWGIAFERMIHRLQETVDWPGKPKSVRGIILPLGVLHGLSDIPDPKQLELLPYFLTGGEQNLDNNVGLDLRYGITSNTVMKVTINPDFGQVEADPSVLNLTAFETFYEEKRPFFSEGSDFFRQRINLFNSRRIGRAPSYHLPDEGDISGLSNYTTILGASKVVGSTSSGINYGLIGAITDEERALVTSNNETKNIIVEPQTKYSIGRIEFPLINNISKFGIMGTNVSRKDTIGSSVIGGDWDISYLNNRLFSTGQIIRSNSNDVVGQAFRFNLGYVNPVWWSARFWYGTYDNQFSINDLGFLRRNDMSWTGGRIELRKQEPWGKFISNNIELKYTQEWNGEGVVLGKEIDIEQDNLFFNYWRVGFFGKLFLPAYNDEDIFRDENAWVYQTELWGYAGPSFNTDRRKKIVLGANIGSGYGENRGKGYRINLWTKIKPIKQLNMEINAMQDKSPSHMQWVDILKMTNDTIRVYANSELITRDLTLRLDWTFSPKLTVQCYAQPFYANMDYKSFFRLESPNTMDLEPYNYQNINDYKNPDFRLLNIIGTFVLRWEYRSGSTIYLVYNFNQNNEFSFSENKWINSEEKAFYFKINYWLKY